MINFKPSPVSRIDPFERLEKYIPFKQSEIIKFVTSQRKELAWIFLASSIANLLMLTPMIYMLQIFDRIFISESILTLLTISGVVLFFYLISAISDYIRTGIMITVGLKMDQALGRRIIRASLKSKITKNINNPFFLLDDFSIVRQWIAGPAVFALFDIPWMPFYIMLMFIMHPILGFVSIGLIGVYACIGIFSVKYLGNQEDYLKKEEEETNSFIYDRLKNEDVIDVYGLAAKFKRTWLTQKKKFYVSLLEKEKKGQAFTQSIKQFQMFSSSVALGTGAILVMFDQLTMATMIAGSMVMMRVLGPVTSVVQAISRISIITEAMKRVEDGLKLVPHESIGQSLRETKKSKINFDDEVAFSIKNLFFKYEDSDKYSLEDISLDITPGESFAVVGKTGAGKSTLGRVLSGLHENYNGEILVNGKSQKAFSPEELEKLVGYLPQEVSLFTGTISDNITGFKNPDSERIIKVTKTVGIHEFILKQYNGYDTQINGGFGQLSGGERQRIGIARSIYNLPKLVVMDEPNSALDESGEAALRHVFLYLKQKNISLLVITHKKTILSSVDKVIKMEFGKITEIMNSNDFLNEEVGKTS